MPNPAAAPSDVCTVQVAPNVFAWLTGLDEAPATDLDEHGRIHNLAVSLGRRGGRKGGAARAARMTADQRSEFASRIARKRWRTPEEQTVALGFTEEEELAWLIAEQERDAGRGHREFKQGAARFEDAYAHGGHDDDE